MTSSACFMSKSVFDMQGCHALTLALARLSCQRSYNKKIDGPKFADPSLTAVSP